MSRNWESGMPQDGGNIFLNSLNIKLRIVSCKKTCPQPGFH
jgi:hypothetical protein